MHTIDIRDWTGTRIVVDADEDFIVTVSGTTTKQGCEICMARAEDTPIWMSEGEYGGSTFGQCGECLGDALDAALSGESADVFLFPASVVRTLINQR